MPNAGKCRSCGAAILWVEGKGGKAMPLDAEPVVDGNIEIRDDKAHYLKKNELGPSPVEVPPRYKSHFATCPDADQFRKRTLR